MAELAEGRGEGAGESQVPSLTHHISHSAAGPVLSHFSNIREDGNSEARCHWPRSCWIQTRDYGTLKAEGRGNEGEALRAEGGWGEWGWWTAVWRQEKGICVGGF